MSPENQAIFFNAVPLFVLAGAYFAVTASLLPSLWNERSRVDLADVALAIVFPCIGIPAAVFGAVVLYEGEAIGGQVWPPFFATLIALIPAVLFLSGWRERVSVVTGGPRAREAEEIVSLRDRELEAVAAITNALARTHDTEAAARVLLDEVAKLFGGDFAAIALASDDGREATGLVARANGADVEWFRDIRLDLQNEPSGIASAFAEGAAVAVYDVEASPLVSRRLVEATGAKSAAFVPLVVDQRVIGVLVTATTAELRAFSRDELTLMQALAVEAALAIERTRSAAALDQALARERLVASISRRVRSAQDLTTVMRVAVTETGRALGASRCFIRLGDGSGPLPMRAEWFAEGLSPIGHAADKLPVSNLAARGRRTVAVEDVATAPELADPSIGSREFLLGLGTRSVLATPIVVVDRMIGVLGLHRPTEGPWSRGEISLAEAVAGEIGLAIHSAALLEENARRLEQQTALLTAAQVLTSELDFELVIQRLVNEVAQLLGADAADCYLLDSERDLLRCAAVNGLPGELVGFEFPVGAGLASAAIAQGKPVLSHEYPEVEAGVPHPAYAELAAAIVAPITWSDETHGVLGVGTRASGRQFRAGDAELLEAFAHLASLALRNAESFEERSRQARIERGFSRIAAVLGEPISLAETLEAVAQAASEALGGASAAVLMPTDGALEPVGTHGIPTCLARFLERGIAEPGGALLACARTRRVLAAPALAEDERFDAEWQSVVRECGYGSLLAVPVEAPRDDSAGLVLVFFAGERRFTDYDLELARNLAGAARGALERSELFEAERRARSLAQQLARTGTLLTTELDPAAVLDEVVEQAPALLGADASAIRLLVDDELVVSAAGGDGGDAALASRSPSTAWPAGDVVHSRAPVAVSNVGNDERLREADPLLREGHAAYLGVPLIGPEGAVQGVLAVYARRPRTWRAEEVEALGALAANASAALSNAELYQRVALEKERSEAILANIADGIVAVDREGKVVLWNAAAARITGVPASDALGRTPFDVLQRKLEPAAGGETGDRLVAIRRGGDEVWLSVTEAVMHDPAGAVAGRIFAFRDISAERVVEEIKSDFVSAVSQELRRPLTSIYGFAETLLRQDVAFGEEERRTFLGYIASESERLTTIVDTLLNVARLESGDLQVQLAPTDVRAVVADVVTSAEETLAVNGHRFVVELPDEPLDAEVDREKLRQVVANLVDNAIRYSPDGGTVTVAARRKDASLEVEVTDEGVGIPEAEQRRIFTKFYRALGAAGDGGRGGTGLGLFIAQGLVTAMGGRMWVRSTQGEGSSFAFELPLAAAPALAARD